MGAVVKSRIRSETKVKNPHVLKLYLAAVLPALYMFPLHNGTYGLFNYILLAIEFLLVVNVWHLRNELLGVYGCMVRCVSATVVGAASLVTLAFLASADSAPVVLVFGMTVVCYHGMFLSLVGIIFFLTFLTIEFILTIGLFIN